MINRLKFLYVKARDHQGLNRYLSNTSWLLGEQIIRLVSGLLVGIWVARYLGPEQFGVFNYAIAFSAIFGSLARLGLDNIVIRDLVRHQTLYASYLGTAFWLKLAGAFFMLGAIGIVIQFTSSDAKTRLYIIIIASGTFFQSFEVIDFYFQSRVQAKFISICKLIQLLLSSILKLSLILSDADLIWFVWVSLVDQITLSASLFISYQKQKISSFIGHFNRKIAIQLMHDSWPQIMTGLVIMIYMRIDQVMIKEILGESQLGIYSVAVRVAEIFYFIPMIITSSVFPAIISSKSSDLRLYHLRIQKLFTFLIWLAIIISIIVTILHEWLVLLLFGKEYKEAGDILVISIWTSIFVFYGAARGRCLIIENMQKIGIICTCVGALTNIILNLVLIDKMGAIGAAIATFIAQGVSAIVVPLFFKNDRVSVLTFARSFNPFRLIK